MGNGDRSDMTARFGPWRREVHALLELLALSALAVTQPTLDLLSKNARLFIAWRATGWQIIGLVMLLVVVPVLGSWLLEVGVGLVAPRARPSVHYTLLGVWAAVLVVEVLKQHTELAGVALVSFGAAAAGAVALLLARSVALRTWLHVLAAAPVIFAALFLFASPATAVVFAHDPTARHVAIHHPHRVVMIVLDEFPVESILDGTGHIDSELYPNLASLGAISTWYRNETTVAPYTEAAVPAILSGRMPTDSNAIPAASAYPRNLFTLLGGRYELNVHESVTRLCPVALCPPTRKLVGVHKGFTGMLEDVTTIWSDFARPSAFSHTLEGGIGGEDVTAEKTADAFVRSLQPAHRPRLDYLHVLLPHFPWHYLPTGQDYFTLRGIPPGIRDGVWLSDAAAQVSHMRHLLQAQAADAVVGRVVRRLRSLGVLNDSLVVVTADHGVAFTAHLPFRGVALATYPSIMWTPLLVKAPHQHESAIDDRPARSVDVLPTMAQHLGIKIPWRVAGRSLLARPRIEGALPLFQWSSNVVAPRPGHKFLEFDGSKGFRRVLTRAAAPTGGPPELRIYRRGRFGHLVGTSAYAIAPLGPPVGSATIDDPIRYQIVNHTAPNTPWSTTHGRVSIPPGSTVAFVANGVVAGVYTTQGSAHDRTSEYYGMVAPVLHDGHNLVQLFRVDGTPAAAVLRSITFVGH